MEVNREEAIRCLDLAKKAKREGDIAKATRLANKSIKLFPTRQAQDFIQEISLSRRSFLPTNQPTPQNNSPPPDPEITSEINRILSCKNLYDILNLPHDAPAADIKKQYRKYALKFHPDKCTAPRASEAFKSISRSFTVLSNTDKRRKYDVMGDVNDNDTHYHTRETFGEEMDPFDLFANMFMGGDFGNGFVRNGRAFRHVRINPRNGQRVYSYSTEHRQHHGNQQDQHEIRLGNILPIIPLLFLLMWSMSTFIFPHNNPYSFERTSYYSVQRRLGSTDNYLYYVHADFEKNYDTKTKLEQIENSVLSDLLYHYGQVCHNDIQIKRQKIYFAKLRGDEEGLKSAENMNTPGCSNQKELQQIRANRG